MKKYLVVLISLVVITTLQAQNILVPHNVYFGDIHLSLDANARDKIQKNVDFLLKHPVYFQVKVDRADTYFPIIEKVFREAGVPDDFKYLAIQESGLVPDAISTSKAEGYWQFKRETATDFGLAVNQNIDERRHIIEASRSAAKYFKQSNGYYKNWVNTLLSYNLGFTGAKAWARPGDADSKNMRITDQTHVYILTFIAHKIAFENFVGKNPQPAITLRELRATPGLSLGEIAMANQTDPVELEKYNRWLLGSRVPADKDYTVLIPVASAGPAMAMATPKTEPIAPKPVALEDPKAEFGTVNGLRVVIAKKGDTKDKLALRSGISTRKFLSFNDMYSFEQIVAGKFYYIERKRPSGQQEYHITQTGENLIDVAQKHAIRLAALRSKNRMQKNESLVPGRVLWLQQTRPANIAVEYRRPDAPGNQEQTQPVVQATASSAPTGSGDSFLDAIKSIFSNTFHKAGAAVKVEEQRPQVARVDNTTFETIDLNPEPESAPAVAVAKTKPETASKPAPVPAAPATPEKPAAEPVVAPVIAMAETGQTIPSGPAAGIEKPGIEIEDNDEDELEEPQAAPAPKVVLKEPSPAESDENQEKAPALYPKTVAKTTEKVPAKTGPADMDAEEPEVPVQPAKTKVVLKDPVTEAAPKAVKVEAPAKPAKAKPEPVPATHTVSKGETLYAISRKYNVTPSDLKYWNKLGDAPLSIGQKLVVSGPAAPADPVFTATAPDQPVPEGTTVIITHRVGEGESMYQISRKYGVSIKEIMEWNKKSDFNVSAGDELVIRSRPGSSRN